MNEVWCLRIITVDGTGVSVWGGREALRPAYDSFLETACALDGTGDRMLTVDGINDTAAADPLSVAFRMEHIAGVLLFRA